MKRTKEHNQKIGDALRGKPKMWLRKRVKVNCLCGKDFEITVAVGKDKRRGKYCSRKCFDKYGRKNRPRGYTFKRDASFGEKIRKVRVEKGLARGIKNPNWKGGLTKIQVVARNHTKYKEWRKAVYKRDNHTCVLCGVEGNGRNLNADHIKPMSLIIQENEAKTIDDILNLDEIFATNNGRTLCVSCHKQTDTYGWRVYNNALRG